MTPKIYRYQLFYPSGNDTAIVYGTDFSATEQLQINNAIMDRHPNVEQVGFVSVNTLTPIFFMAGGGFCGNGFRSAVWHFLQGVPSTIQITIPNIAGNVLGGISNDGNVWVEVPRPEIIRVIHIEEGLSLVELIGVSHIVVSPAKSRSIIFLDEEERCSSAKKLLEQVGLIERVTCGVIYTQKTEKGYRIVPCVHDLGVDTMKQETACGTGSIAAVIAISVIQRKSVSLMVEQPSGERISASVKLSNGRIQRAIISGKVKSDGEIYTGAIII